MKEMLIGMAGYLLGCVFACGASGALAALEIEGSPLPVTASHQDASAAGTATIPGEVRHA